MFGIWRKYLIQFFCFFASILMLAITINILIDPYMVFDAPTVAGVNEVKPRAYQQASLAKQHLLQRTRPRTLILGNSRAEIGLDPASSAWPPELRPVFNAAQAGAGYGVALDRLREALAGDSRLSLVLLGVDFQDFLVLPGSGAVAADSGDGALGLLQSPRLQTVAVSTMTLGALQDSLLTLFGQDPVEGITMRADGFNPMREYDVHVRRIGHFGLFAQKQADYRLQYRSRPRPDFAIPDDLVPHILVRELIDLALANGVSIVLIVHPYHATYLDMLAEMGFRQSFCDWVRSLSLLVDEDRRSVENAVARLVDFSGYNAFTTEPIPAYGDHHTKMRWFWEAGHYQSALGDRMLGRLFGAVDVGFGVELGSNRARTEQSRGGSSEPTPDDGSRQVFASPGFCSPNVAAAVP
jgi:hypothetical protein